MAALFLFIRSRGAISITDPSLAFLNLAGDELSHLIDRDRSVLASLFTTVEFGAGYPIPSCDVLFIYANVGVDGSIGLGAGVTIRHLAENAGAVIAVLASDNPAENIVTASRYRVQRRRTLFGFSIARAWHLAVFFKELFTRMYSGQSMPMAWAAISPQHSGGMHDDLPQTICHIEAGQVKFRRIK